MNLRNALMTCCADPWAASVLWKSAPAAPPAPNYAAAATATAQGNKDAAIAAQQGSMVNQNTPYGSLTYTQDPTSRFSDSPSYTQDVNLSPVGQQLLDYTQQSQLGLGQAQNQALGQLNNGGMDLNSVDKVAQKSYSDQTKLLDPTWNAATDSQETKLANQGLQAGDAAYDRSMNTFNQGKNSAYTQASLNATNTMPQTYQLASAQYNQPLNYLNALMSGSQVTNPQFGSSPAQQTVAGPNMLGAAQAQGQYDQGLYNAGVGATNSANSGTATIASAAMAAAAAY